MKRFEILVVGRGRLANELLEGLKGEAISCVTSWEDRAMPASNSDGRIVVHAGSGRELPGAIDFCADTRSLLFELSTAGSFIPESVAFPVIRCPNVNLQMLRFMAMVRRAAGYYKGQKIAITESHQAAKKTKPGTALYLARQLGVPESEIRSERNPERQEKLLGIPHECLDRHAFHRIEIESAEGGIMLETRVFGKTAYANSLSGIISMVTRMDLRAGHHDIVDLIMKNI